MIDRWLLDPTAPHRFSCRAVMRPSSRAALGVVALSATLGTTSGARAQAGGQWQWSTGGQGAAPEFPSRPSSSRRSTTLEVGTLYGTSVGYGVGVGIWIDAELGIEDPGTRFIPPAILGVAAPIGVYFLDQPAMPRGMPSAIAAGMAIGAGEGLGIASFQFVTAKEEDAWGFRGLARSVTIGSTLGGAAGYAVAVTQEPSPKSNLFVSSSVLWGTAIGSMFGYGLSPAGVGYGESNDSAALGGLIGFNVGLGAGAGLSAAYIPSWEQIGWMWAGAGIGFAASVPVYLFYAGEDTPPAKRGLIFQGTATTLGIVAGGIFASGDIGSSRGDRDEPRGTAWATVDYVGPMAVPRGAGAQVGGTLW